MQQRSALEQAYDLVNGLFAREGLKREVTCEGRLERTIVALVHMTWGSSVHFTDTSSQEVHWMIASDAVVDRVSRRGPGLYTLRAANNRLFAIEE